MPINAGYEYQKAEEEYRKARTNSEKLNALKEMLRVAPKHKGAEVLLKQIKERIAKIKGLEDKQRKLKKSGYSVSVKKEGAAQVCVVGLTNSGKSTLLYGLTGAKVEIADYEFTTKKPEQGIMDYFGIKIQIVEIPAIVKNFNETSMGPSYLGIMQHSDLLVLMFRNPGEKKILDNELRDVDVTRLIYNGQGKKEFSELIWEKLGLIKVYTKQRGKPKEKPPIALEKGATVRDVAEKVHRDFLKRFKFARIFGNSAKFDGQMVGLDHLLKDDDAVELHMR